MPSLPVVQHPSDVLLRARCLAASALVAFAQRDPELLELADHVADGLRDQLTPLERRALDGEPLSPAELSRLSWQTVSVAVLQWALHRRAEPPLPDEPPHARPTIDDVVERPELVADDRLRPMRELRTFARDARAWAWGTRDEQLVRSTGSTSLQQPVPENARITPLFPESQVVVSAEELFVDGLTVRDVDDERLDQLISINSERLRAARWLIGESDWDAVALRV